MEIRFFLVENISSIVFLLIDPPDEPEIRHGTSKPTGK